MLRTSNEIFHKIFEAKTYRLLYVVMASTGWVNLEESDHRGPLVGSPVVNRELVAVTGEHVNV